MKLSSYGLLFATFVALTNACGGDDDAADDNGGGGSGPGTSGSGQTGPAANCPGRCSTKATACMLPTNIVDPYCQQLCGAAPTEGQMACLEGKSCQELTNAGANPLSLCPAGNPGGGGSGQGGSGQGGSGGPAGSGTGTIPDTMTVSGRRKPGNQPIHILNDAMTQIASSLSGGAAVTYSYADVRGNLNLQGAASKSVTAPSSPSTSDCADIAGIGVTLNASEFGYTFTGVDALPATGCADFADAVHEQGLTMRFTDVPVLNSSSKVKEVIVDVDP